jgi:hypothetical protein
MSTSSLWMRRAICSTVMSLHATKRSVVVSMNRLFTPQSATDKRGIRVGMPEVRAVVRIGRIHSDLEAPLVKPAKHGPHQMRGHMVSDHPRHKADTQSPPVAPSPLHSFLFFLYFEVVRTEAASTALAAALGVRSPCGLPRLRSGRRQ